MIYIFYVYKGPRLNILEWSIGTKRSMYTKFGESLLSGKYSDKKINCAVNPLFVFHWAMFEEKFIGDKDTEGDVVYE